MRTFYKSIQVEKRVGPETIRDDLVADSNSGGDGGLSKAQRT